MNKKLTGILIALFITIVPLKAFAGYVADSADYVKKTTKSIADNVKSFTDSFIVGDNLYFYANALQSTASTSSSTITLDKKSNGFNAGVGYNLQDGFAIELGYVKLGEISASTSTSTLGTIKYEGYTLGGVYSIPTTIPIIEEKINIDFRAGLYFWDTSGSITGVKNAGNGTDGYAGIGISYELYPGLSLITGYTQYQGGDKFKAINIGITSNF